MPDFGLSTLQQADYIVYVQGGVYYALNTITASITSNTLFSSLMSTLNTALSAGGTIALAAGTYNVDAPIVFSNNVSLIGDGRKNTTIVRTTTSTNNAALAFNGSNLTIARLTVNGNYPTNTSNANSELQLFNGGTNILCDDLEVINFNGQGIATNTINAVITNCVITAPNNVNAGILGIYTDPGTGSNAFTSISNCGFYNCADNAVFLSGKTSITNCYFKGNAIASGGQLIVNAGAGISATIMNNIFDAGGALSSGIEVSSTGSDIAIINNWITNQNKWGIVANTGSLSASLIIANNIIKNSQTGAGIAIGGAGTNFTISNNICYDDQGTHTQPYGITIDQIAAAANNFIIKDNIFYNNTTAGILDQSTGTTKIITNNIGYNPVGVITNPFPTSGAGNIGNVAQTAAKPASTTVQTVITTPKTISITGSTVTVVAVNGTTVATGTPFNAKLGIGETIAVTYSSTPVFKVYCE